CMPPIMPQMMQMPMMQMPMMQMPMMPMAAPMMPPMPSMYMPPIMPQMPQMPQMMPPMMAQTPTPVYVQVLSVPQPGMYSEPQIIPQQVLQQIPAQTVPQDIIPPVAPPPPAIAVPTVAPPPAAIDVPPVVPPPAAIDVQAPQQQVAPAMIPPQKDATLQPELQPPVDMDLNEPQIDPAVAPLVQALSIIAPEDGKQPSFAEEAAAINVIAQFANTYQAANNMISAQPNNPDAINAREKVKTLIDPLLIDEKTFKALANVATRDTSALPQQERQIADQNKTGSMWTLAMLQKIFRSEMDRELQKENMPRISLGEIPGVSQIVDNVRRDPNPRIREDAIIALMEITDPRNPKDAAMMKSILQTVAKHDNSKKVKKTAKDALKDIKKNNK
ncbi:MAG: hypothetical protein GX568_10805, partial [Candidatus Gastranaerophilales bacterium]|nr:hypothetical protein [Candidatus Gastranaerophilales bacterium]